jgi:choline kinase
MKALMLAAGLGRRLYGDENQELPKALLEFDGQTLLQRHIDTLVACGLSDLTLIVGHRSDDIIEEARRVAPEGFVNFVFNPRYREGPKISLAAGESVLRSGESVIFMDADVLYHPILIERLVDSKHSTSFVMDRVFQSTDDFVKVCLLDDRFVDFGKQVGDTHDTVGEWPGFCKFSPDVAHRVASSVEGFIARGEDGGAYEDAFREVLVDSTPGTFQFEDITGVPWVEIDFDSDLEKATSKVFPRIADYKPSVDLEEKTA